MMTPIDTLAATEPEDLDYQDPFALPDYGAEPPDPELAARPLAAFYGRVSTDQQDLRTQLAWGQRYAEDRGFHLPEALVFLDEDRSGRLPLVERERGKALWDLLHGPGLSLDGQTLPVRHVLVSVADRWGRDPDDAVRNVRYFHERGVKIHLADVPQYNPDDPMCLMTLRMRFAFAEFEVGLIRKRIRDKFAEKRSRGELCGHAGYGFRCVERDGVKYEEPDETETGWLFHMQRRRAEGWGYERIATELRRLGVPTKSGTGRWQAGNVRNVLLAAERRAKRSLETTTP